MTYYLWGWITLIFINIISPVVFFLRVNSACEASIHWWCRPWLIGWRRRCWWIPRCVERWNHGVTPETSGNHGFYRSHFFRVSGCFLVNCPIIKSFWDGWHWNWPTVGIHLHHDMFVSLKPMLLQHLGCDNNIRPWTDELALVAAHAGHLRVHWEGGSKPRSDASGCLPDLAGTGVELGSCTTRGCGIVEWFTVLIYINNSNIYHSYAYIILDEPWWYSLSNIPAAYICSLSWILSDDWICLSWSTHPGRWSHKQFVFHSLSTFTQCSKAHGELIKKHLMLVDETPHMGMLYGLHLSDMVQQTPDRRRFTYWVGGTVDGGQGWSRMVKDGKSNIDDTWI